MSASSRCTLSPAESPLMPLVHNTRSRRSGFTLLEMIVVITITGVLTSIVFLSFSRVQGQLGTRAAQSNFLSLHAQARALAVERGQLSSFVVTEATGVVRIEMGGVVINELSLANEFDVTVDSGGDFTQCFSPRGIADLGCTTFSTVRTVTFTRGNRTAEVALLPLGQAR